MDSRFVGQRAKNFDLIPFPECGQRKVNVAFPGEGKSKIESRSLFGVIGSLLLFVPILSTVRPVCSKIYQKNEAFYTYFTPSTSSTVLIISSTVGIALGKGALWASTKV